MSKYMASSGHIHYTLVEIQDLVFKHLQACIRIRLDTCTCMTVCLCVGGNTSRSRTRRAQCTSLRKGPANPACSDNMGSSTPHVPETTQRPKCPAYLCALRPPDGDSSAQTKEHSLQHHCTACCTKDNQLTPYALAASRSCALIHMRHAVATARARVNNAEEPLEFDSRKSATTNVVPAHRVPGTLLTSSSVELPGGILA